MSMDPRSYFVMKCCNLAFSELTLHVFYFSLSFTMFPRMPLITCLDLIFAFLWIFTNF